MTDLARARDLALASASDLARTLAGEFDLAITLVVNLANAHDLASARDLARALAHASDLALTSASDLARALARASTNDLVAALASARALASDLALASALASDFARASDLACALTKVSFMTIELARIPGHPHKTDFIFFTQIFVLLSRSLEQLVLLCNYKKHRTSPITSLTTQEIHESRPMQ